MNILLHTQTSALSVVSFHVNAPLSGCVLEGSLSPQRERASLARHAVTLETHEHTFQNGFLRSSAIELYSLILF